MTTTDIRFLVFDIESVADGSLVSKVRFPTAGLAPDAAVAKYREELLRDENRDFIPYTYHIPVSVVVAKVGPDYRLDDIVALDEPKHRPHIMTRHFWRGWEAYRHPTLVSFNGRAFDVPLMELSAFRYGLSLPRWFNLDDKSWEQHRGRYNTHAHLDLCEILTNFGTTRFNGGLNLAAHVLGKPGKIDVQGHMVQDLYNAGKLAEISDYCRCDVLDTYFVFLRVAVLLGQLDLDSEQRLVAETREWLQARASSRAVYARYLEHWGQWENPWLES